MLQLKFEYTHSWTYKNSPICENLALVSISIYQTPWESKLSFQVAAISQQVAESLLRGRAIFGFLFLEDPPALSCKESADANTDGIVDISDGISILERLFTGGPEPAAPGPTKSPCGIDPDPPGSPGDLGCESYIPCP